MSSMSEPNDLRSSVSSFLRSSSETFLMLTSSDSAHRWSSSENAACSPVWMYSARASSELCSSATRSFSSARRRSSSDCISFSSVRQVAPARLLVDPGDDRRGEVQDLLELLGRHVEQVADATRHALEEPDVAHRRGEVDVAHALAADLGARDLDAAALADDALVTDALVLAAVALPVLGRTEDALAEQAVLLGLERAVVDRLRLGDLARAPGTDLLGGREADLDGVEVVDVDQGEFLLL